MRLFLKACILMTLVMSMSAYASRSSTHQNNAELKAQLDKITYETQRLQREIVDLRAKLQRSQANARRKSNSSNHAQSEMNTSGSHYHSGSQAPNGSASYHLPPPYHEIWTVFRHPVTVTTSPFLGIRSAFDASDLLEQQSTWNEDLTLLQKRSQLVKALAKEGVSINRPIIEISGGIEGGALYANGFGGASSSVYLGTAQLDVNAIASQWASAYFSLDFDSSPAITGSRVPNSRIYLRRGFLTLGNLNTLPIYFTLGQLYPPFGRYSSAMVSAPLTLSMARVLARAAILGLFTHGFYAQLYGYDGSQTTANGFVFKQGGGNLGYQYKSNSFGIDLGSGVISNIADSEGMQSNRIPSQSNIFSGFGQVTTFQFINFPPLPPTNVTVDNLNNLRHRVPAADVHVETSLGPVTLIGEYIASIRRFNPADLTYNGIGALPRAFHTEIDYLFHLYSRPVTVGIAYGQTSQAFALNLPKRSFWAVLSTSIWKDTIESLEYRHDTNYPTGTTATGGTIVPPVGPPSSPAVPNSTGGTRNIVTAQIGVYF